MVHSEFYKIVSMYITLEPQAAVLQSLFHYAAVTEGTTLIEAGKSSVLIAIVMICRRMAGVVPVAYVHFVIIWFIITKIRESVHLTNRMSIYYELI